MAQDFAAAFHLGSTDTGIATVDADGVALASIQELKKQLDAVKAQNAKLAEQNATFEARLAALEAKLAK
jgi:phage shock protein A